MTLGGAAFPATRILISDKKTKNKKRELGFPCGAVSENRALFADINECLSRSNG